MAGNMQPMTGQGSLMAQQLRKPLGGQLQQLVFQTLNQSMPPSNGMAWQPNINDRMGKTMELLSNITLAMPTIDIARAADFACAFESEVLTKSPSKEAYDQAMANKILEFFKKRQANEPSLQNAINANAQAQAHAQAQAQALMQMGRGAGQTPQQAFQHLQHPMQPSPIPQPQQAQQPQQTQQQLLQQQQQMAMAMANQAGRGMAPGPQPMGMPGAPNRALYPGEMARLGPADKAKVMDLAQKMMAQATDQQKTNARLAIQTKLSQQQLADFHNQGKDPLHWWYQNQAFHALKATSMNRYHQAGGPQNQNNQQAAIMQQQHSQQSLQQRQSMMNGGAQAAGPLHDFSHFTTDNMESIKDQQMTGLMAQQAGQVVVPASGGAARNATPQPGNQSIPNQQAQTQTPRSVQQQQQQAKMNQAAQQSQAQLQVQAQMKQMQTQQQMTGGIPTSQSPAMNTLNTPVSRPPGNMNPTGAQGMAQGGIQFGDQRFNQGIQRPNSQVYNNMLSNLSPEQRQALNGLPPDKLNEVLRRWQSHRQEQMAMNGAQMMQGHMANRPQSQFGQMPANMAGGPGPSGMPQPSAATGAPNQQQPMQMGRMPVQGNQIHVMMDSMDVPPNIISQMGQLPLGIKKWRDLKMWISQNNTITPNIRSQLAGVQQKQFQILLQRRASMPQPPAQNANMNPPMAAAAPPPPCSQMPNQQTGIQRPMGNMPPQFQVTAQEMMHVRSQKPGLVNVPDEQLRQMILQMKRSSWQAQQLPQQQQQQQQQVRNQQVQAAYVAQVQAQNPPQQPGQNPMTGSQGAMQLQQPPQPNRTPQPSAQPALSAMGQTAIIQTGGQKQQPNTTPGQNQARNTRPQAPKNLKRPSPDDATDVAGAKASASVPQPASQPQQQQAQKATPQFSPQQLTPQQEAALNPEQRARYELMKAQMQNKAGAQGSNTVQSNMETMMRLRAIAQEEQKQFAQESMPDIPMSPQELLETGNKLRRIVIDMGKVGRGLNKWYTLVRDDARAKMFFRTRLRIIKQFADGEPMSILKGAFSIRSSELDQARAMLESMAKDLAASVLTRNMMKPGGQMQQAAATQATPQVQGAQLPLQQQQQQQQQLLQQQQQQQLQKSQQAQPAPLNAANLEKNTQALNKMNQQKAAAKANQAPPAPTTTQPPFPFGETSPHGNPNYMSKAKDLNLQLPPARKKPKLANQQQQSGQTPQAATPSPQISKNGSPDLRRAQPQPPPEIYLCPEPECDLLLTGFASPQALQRHTEEEHIKPMEDPVKFVQENLALALGLESNGSLKRPVDGAPAMSLSTSKQGQTPGNLGGTPLSQDGTAMKRSASALSKTQDGKSGVKTSKVGNDKQEEASSSKAAADPWANSPIDQALLIQNLGFEFGLPGMAGEARMLYRSLSRNDTPESSKDGEASEPNSDISEGATIDIDMDWHTIDPEMLEELRAANISAEDLGGASLDPSAIVTSVAPDWDDVQVDFSKPWPGLDMEYYSLRTN